MTDTGIKQNKFLYGVMKLAANTVARVKFKREFLRNEIKDKEGPFVVIANHAAALDFVNLIGATKRPMHFVISSSFYQTIPVPGVMPRLGLIPKQQFQTTLADLRTMKRVIDEGGILVIYPTGLMSDDGRPTPLPAGTCKFLKLLNTDVYMAKNIGTYFSMPKWRKGGMRGGKTYLDVYKLLDGASLADTDVEEIRVKMEEALDFDAYAEQERYLVKYQNGNNIEGLENVLYMCPHCGREFTVKTRDTSVIYCDACGFCERADEYQFLHKESEVGEEIRYPSDWNARIRAILRERVQSGEDGELSAKVEIQTVAAGKSRFEAAGEGVITLTKDLFRIEGKVGGEDVDVSIPTASFATLPYKPGKYIELQHGSAIYRCLPEDGRLAVKFIDLLYVFHRLHTEALEEEHKQYEAAIRS